MRMPFPANHTWLNSTSIDCGLAFPREAHFCCPSYPLAESGRGKASANTIGCDTEHSHCEPHNFIPLRFLFLRIYI